MRALGWCLAYLFAYGVACGLALALLAVWVVDGGYKG